ncbi:MAG: transglycosylase domain-containing protein, partial [Eubacteriaceae bacterium]|nr:transglycosylase domain-containing protein [Eubacteriaceae bacterium]
DISSEQTFTDSINRKFKEISIAWQLEKKYSKDQILEMYLNEYYFGSSAYGIEEAAKTYFGKDIANCNLAECAMLAGLPQAPSAYAPNYNFQAAKNRQEIVLDRMVKEGYITQQQCDEAKATEITIVPWDSETLDNQITAGYEKFVNQALQEYAEAQAPNVMKQEGLSKEDAIDSVRTQIASGGYKLYTTVNTNMQTTAVNISEGSYPEGSEITDAIVTVDTDGAVRAYYGGNTDIDMCNTARQPGSNIKPLYYSGAIEQGLFTADSTVSDATQSYGGYTPKNYDNTSMGNITITRALVMSRNVPSVYVMNTMGVDNAMSWMKNMGISTIVDDDYNLATATGGMTYGIKPLEMAAAFNCFNNSGVYNQPYYVTQVQKSNGDKVFDKSQLNLNSHQVMSQGTASTMWNILQQVVTSGTATAAQTGYATAGKTGTTDNAEDLWFTGMTGSLTTSIWVGTVNHGVVGGSESTICCNLYRSYMSTLGNNGWISDLQ